jgi:hypothetical protein
MGEYIAVCGRVASAFKDISAEVNAVGASLRAAGRDDLCEAVRVLQQQEKEQLRLVRAPGRLHWARSLLPARA